MDESKDQGAWGENKRGEDGEGWEWEEEEEEPEGTHAARVKVPVCGDSYPHPCSAEGLRVLSYWKYQPRILSTFILYLVF